MKAVLLSIKPKYCELIANGQKTVEIRKSCPKIDVPFKCYIYCTKCKISGTRGKYLHTSDKKGILLGWNNPNDCDIVVQPENYTYKAYSCGGKVIGEFVCDEVDTYKYDKEETMGKGYWGLYFDELKAACLSFSEALKYGGRKDLYGWHISDLVIYDKPKELSEFILSRPPQSWCYMEGIL